MSLTHIRHLYPEGRLCYTNIGPTYSLWRFVITDNEASSDPLNLLYSRYLHEHGTHPCQTIGDHMAMPEVQVCYTNVGPMYREVMYAILT